MDKLPGTVFDNQLIELDSVDSTNNYAMARIHAGLAFPGQVYFAHRQWAGKGQRGKNWISEPGQNISMSLVLDPRSLPLSGQFLLGAAVSLACLKKVQEYVPEGWSLKWPNDLYWRDRKAAGILIENIIKGKEWLYAVIGVGMNLNQTSFPPELSHAVSLKQISSQSFEPLVFARELAARIGEHIAVLQQDAAGILKSFNQSLYKRGETVQLKKGNTRFETRIRSVDAQGRLLTVDSAERKFSHGEVEFILDGE
ncbi:MAG TPA: biotin--[acetyl-CoA-carboxylase] ligase [Puia sp.]